MGRIEHAIGEIVIVRNGNYLENRAAGGKSRPGVILVPGDSCHWVAALTTQKEFKSSGQPRQRCPAGPDTGLRSDSYFWSQKPCRISRLDVLRHVGWADLEMVDAIRDYLVLNSGAVQALREYRHSLSGLVA